MYAINQGLCTFCGGCSAVCPAMAIVVHDASSGITPACCDCGACALFCPVEAIAPAADGKKEPAR